MGKEIRIDLGNTKGLSRQIDKLGRVVLPMEFRKELELEAKDSVKIYLLEKGMYIEIK